MIRKRIRHYRQLRAARRFAETHDMEELHRGRYYHWSNGDERLECGFKIGEMYWYSVTDRWIKVFYWVDGEWVYNHTNYEDCDHVD